MIEDIKIKCDICKEEILQGGIFTELSVNKNMVRPYYYDYRYMKPIPIAFHFHDSCLKEMMSDVLFDVIRGR